MTEIPLGSGLFERNHPWMYLDPDNRKDPPDTGPYCCRCMKRLRIRDGISWISVTVHAKNPWVKKDPLGRDLIGSDCLQQIQKNLVPIDKY